MKSVRQAVILYFSATGNTKFVAEELGRTLQDEVRDLVPLIRTHDTGPLVSDKPFVFCSPIYADSIPTFFRDFLREVRLEGSTDVYLMLTAGAYTGIGSAVAEHIVRNRGLNYLGCAEFMMPSNYIALFVHKLPEPERIVDMISAAREQAASVAEAIARREKLATRHVPSIEVALTEPLLPLVDTVVYRTSAFTVSDACISCGLCERRCPALAIEMRDGRPHWRASTCFHCMACIQMCPTRAIDYGKRTQERPRYRIKDYLPLLEERS